MFEIEANLAPGLECLRQLREERAPPRQDLGPSLEKLAALVARLDASLEGATRFAWRRRGYRRVAQRAAAELEDRIVAEDLDERGMCQTWIPPDAAGKTPGSDAQS